MNFILSLSKKKKITLTHTHTHPPHGHLPQMKKKKKLCPQDHPGVYGTLPRIGISDHELLRVQGRLHGLRSVPASIAVKLFHRLDLAYRLPRLCARAPAADRPAWCPAPNNIHILFPRRLRSCQLEATELSVPSPIFLSLSSSYFFIAFFITFLLPCEAM